MTHMDEWASDLEIRAAMRAAQEEDASETVTISAAAFMRLREDARRAHDLVQQSRGWNWGEGFFAGALLVGVLWFAVEVVRQWR